MASFFKSKRSKPENCQKFKESPNTPVFTTRFVMDENKTITYVSHDEDDGSWQFFSKDDFDDLDEVARIVRLQEVVALDDSLLELSDMPKGYYAVRKDKQHPWVIHEHE